MRISTRLYLSLAVTVGLTAGIAIVSLSYDTAVKKQAEISTQAGIQVQEVGNLALLGQEYFANPEVRMERQWVAQIRRIRGLMRALPAHRSSALDASVSRLDALFSQAQDSYRQRPPGQRLDERESERLSLSREMLASRMRLEAARAQSGVFAIHAEASERSNALLGERANTLLGLMVLLVTVVGALTFTVVLSISRSLSLLVGGAKALAQGDLAHKLAVEGNDEAAVLAGQFNAMAANLEQLLRHECDNVAALEREVAERKRAGTALRALSSRHEAILAAVPDIIAEVDANKLYTWMNQAGFEFFGDDALGKEAAFYVEGRQDTYGAVQPLFNGDTSVVCVETWQRRRDGEKCLLAWWCRVLKDANGNVTGALSTGRDITERKRTEEALSQSESTLRGFYETAPIMMGIVELTEDGNIIHIYDNPATARFFGSDYRDTEDRLASELGAPPEAIQRWVARYRESQHSGRPINFEYAHPVENGVLWLSATVATIGPSVSGRTRFCYVTENITERKRAEMTLQASETMLRYYVENTPAAVAIFDTEMRYLLTSKRWLTDYRLGERDVTGISHYEVFPEIPEHWKKIHRRCLAGAIERCDEDPFQRLDGSLDWVRWDVRPWRNSSGAIGGIIMFTEVITERKQAEAALRESEDRYRDLVEHSQDLICTHDLEGRILSVNPWAAKILGYELHEIPGMNIRDVLAASVRHEFDNYLATIRAVGAAKGLMLMQTRTGEKRIWEYANTLRTVGVPTPVVRGMAHDITERKRAEDELQSSRGQLRALAARLNTAREEETILLAREIHDELGQTLTGLKMDLSWLASRLDQDRRALKKKADSMLGIVDSTIDTIRNIATRLRPKMLDDLGLVAAMEWQAQDFRKRASIKCEVVSNMDTAKLGPEQSIAVYRITQEALTNVARYAAATRVDISFHEESGYMILEVRDNGKGIGTDEIAANESIGLLGMRERAIAVGGQLAIEGFPGKGTVVTLRMPFAAQ